MNKIYSNFYAADCDKVNKLSISGIHVDKLCYNMPINVISYDMGPTSNHVVCVCAKAPSMSLVFN